MSGEPKILDHETLLTLHDAVGDSIHKIINVFLENTPKNLAEMQQALARGDLETVGRLAHSLKSSSANLGALQLSSVALGLEQAINNGEQDVKKITAVIAEMSKSFDLVSVMFADIIK